MAHVITGTGEYTSPRTGQQVGYSFEYPVLSEEEKQALDAIYPKAGTLVRRMLKVDANNTARESAKSANGDSLRKPQTEEQKAQSKAERKELSAMKEYLRAQGITSLDQLKKTV